MAIDTTEWEQIAGRRDMKVKAIALTVLVWGLAGLAFLEGVPKSAGPWIFAGAFFSFGLFFLYSAFRPPKSHPFIKVLANRPNEVVRSYVYEHYINGGYSATWLTLELANQKQVRLNIPRGESMVWQGKLQALLPAIEHRQEVAPGA